MKLFSKCLCTIQRDEKSEQKMDTKKYVCFALIFYIDNFLDQAYYDASYISTHYFFKFENF